MSNVNHPSHYHSNSGIEVIDAIEAWKLNFSRGNAIKYIARASYKDSDKEIEDLEKARWYIDREIQRLQKIKKETMTINIEPSNCTVTNTTDEIKNYVENMFKKSPFWDGWLSSENIDRCLHTNEEEHIFENGKEIQ